MRSVNAVRRSVPKRNVQMLRNGMTLSSVPPRKKSTSFLFQPITLPRLHLPSLFTQENIYLRRPPAQRREKPSVPVEAKQSKQGLIGEIPIESVPHTSAVDLVDLLSEEHAQKSLAVPKPKEKRPKETTTEINAAEFLGTPASQNLSESMSTPEERQNVDAEQLGASIEQFVLRKRKKAQALEMVIRQTSSATEKKKTKQGTAELKDKVLPQPAQDPEEVLRALELKALHKPHKGFGTFFRSVNYIGMGKYRSAFVQNLATMLSAGLPLVEALQTIQMEVRARAMRKVIQRILDLVESGHPLWLSMEEQGFFTPYEVALVRVGEEAGNLARNMEYLAVQQEKDRSLRQKVKMAMIYPTIVLVLMFIIVMGLGMFVLPNLIQVLYSLNVDLPITTRIVIAFTEYMTQYGAQTAGGIIGGFILLILLTKYTPFRGVAQWFIFRIPGIGRLAREASIARFGVILGGLLQAGVPLVDSLDSLVEVTTIVSFKRFYRKLRDRVIVGDSFATCFHSIRRSRRILPLSVQQLVVTGEKSGTLSATCLKVAAIYDRKAEETAQKLPVILEPTLLLCIGSLVGFIAFSIIIPIYSAVGNVSGR
jgi:type IV pilus assembly protein PilC